MANILQNARIRNIALHHTGGVEGNPYASTAHVTPKNIDEWHKRRWEGAKGTWAAYESSLGHFGGYNVVYDPKTRSFAQFRAIGEETAAQRGHNFDTLSICIIGNFTRNPHKTPDPKTGKDRLVDPMTPEIKSDIKNFLVSLLEGKAQSILNLEVIPGTKIEFGMTRIRPHRLYQEDTECYGNGLSDDYFRNLVIDFYQKKIGMLKKLVELYARVRDLMIKKNSSLGRIDERGCPGFIN